MIHHQRFSRSRKINIFMVRFLQSIEFPTHDRVCREAFTRLPSRAAQSMLAHADHCLCPGNQVRFVGSEKMSPGGKNVTNVWSISASPKVSTAKALEKLSRAPGLSLITFFAPITTHKEHPTGGKIKRIRNVCGTSSQRSDVTWVS